MAIKIRLQYWPLLTGIWFICTFVISYFVALFNGHIYYFFPYISDTGTLPPESCIFGQMLNIGALLMLVTMYIRYRVVALLKYRGSVTNYKEWNNWSNLFGIMSCFGMSMVGNFQETNVTTAHFIGAFLAFGMGLVYCIIHAYLTLLSCSSKCLKCVRILLSALFIPLYITTTVCSTVSFKQFNGPNQFKWTDKDAGYTLHLVATFTEWTIAISMI
ncbi:DNA damage-regulated autophagy modulator protein 2-like, partial [Asbolus verrucosus]